MFVPDTEAPINPEIPVDMGCFTSQELRKAILKLRSGKPVRRGDVPIEVFKVYAEAAGQVLEQLLELFNRCLELRQVPREWLEARVTLIFKKGDPASCDNYRPICMTTVAYKIYTTMLKQRLLKAGVEDRIWHSQFGFRRDCSTTDAIYAARRQIELACARRHGCISLLALDWKKAFDSVNVDSLMDALRRFGLPSAFCQVVSGLMLDRSFYVEESGCRSEASPMKSGITQGCTLSPLLFTIVMTVLMADAVKMLPPSARSAYDSGDLSDLVYADDTLLLGVSTEHIESFLQAVEVAGKRYGLELHMGKLQLLQVQCSKPVSLPCGAVLQPIPSLTYLGATLAEDGRVGSEINRRIGFAKAEFRAVQKLWNHAAVSLQDKLRIFKGLIESKLLYGLATVCLTVAQVRHLDGFQARCLRQILRIQPAFLSRVSNDKVLERAGVPKASATLLSMQLLHLGKVIRAPEGSVLKAVSFIPGTLHTAADRYVRRVGRPRKEWITSVLPHALQQTNGDTQRLIQLTRTASEWKGWLRRAS